MSVSALAACGVVERFDGLPLDDFVARHHQLCHALAVLHDEGLVAVIDEQNFQFAAVVGIDGARRIEHGDAVAQGQARAGAHLPLVAFG